MPWRCYVVLVPAQTTAPNLRPSWRVVVDRMGFEPTTSAMRVRRSSY